MEKIELLEESKRCLKCKNHPCQKSCPIGTRIPEIIDMFQKGEELEAGKILFENNPMSLVCSLICPFEKQCMGSCVRGIKGESVNFPAIENYLMEKYLKETEFQNVSNNKKVAVVGGGPGGLSGAFYLSKKGYDVTVYDDHERMGGMLRYGIPSFRLSKDKVDLLERKAFESGIKFKENTTFSEESLKNLKTEKNYHGVLVSTGAWLPKELNIDGVERENVYYGIDYLKDNVDLGSGKKVVVIGAGNVAMDVARTAKRQGNDVLIAYRKKLEFAPATKVEINEAIEDGVRFLTEVTPIRITDKGIMLEDNNTKNQFLYECDNVIISVSQKSQFNVENLDGYFYGGDLVTGPETVVKASLTGKESAKLLDDYLARKE
ncbi:FAD-dependent oxidoreductase [Fusobacterium sp.]|uniref:FAD-dependent oxidoreductase n=1 Tax=Fusobacterium sp. TaxID=68766 RepID=UPI00262B23D8|nr:FAD-dependent oxidoreductase [Fusobacterium sp.]